MKWPNLLVQGETINYYYSEEHEIPLKTTYSPVLNTIVVTVTFNSNLHFPNDHFDHSLFERKSSLMNTSIPLKPNMTHNRPQYQSRHNEFIIIKHNLRPKELWVLLGT